MPPEVSARLRRLKPMREPPGRVRYVRSDEEKILATLSGWLRAIVDAARCSGMRLGEITSMRWRQVDRARLSIGLARTKNGRRRVVPITPALASVLDGLPAATPEGYVFPIPLPEVRANAKRTEDVRRVRRVR